MKKCLVSLVIFQFLKVADLNSLDSKSELDNVNFKVEEINEMEEVRDEDSHFKNKKNLELKNFYDTGEIINQINLEKYEKLVKNVDNYVQRYVSLFLITSNLLNHEIKDFAETINIDLELTLTGEELNYLQNYAKSKSDSPYPRNLMKLDAIFSKIARLKEKSIMEKINSSKIFSMDFDFFDYLKLFKNPIVYHFLPFIIVLIVTWIIYHHYFSKSFYILITIIVNSMIFWESLITYWKKLKEADIEIFVKTLQTKNIPENCNLENSSWYNRISNYFFGVNCVQYYKDINKSSVEEVSLFQCIIDTYGLYLFQIPLKIFGASIKGFTDELTGFWPFPMKLFYLPLMSFVIVVMLFFFLILLGKRMKFSFFGTSVEVGDNKAVPVSDKEALLKLHFEKPTKDTKKLKLLPKSKSFRRLPIKSGLKRKMKIPKTIEIYSSEGSDSFEDTQE